MKQILFLTAIFLFSAAAWAQPVQTIRGRVTDKESKTPLPCTNVVLVGSNPLIGSSTGNDGNFRLEKVPLGRQSVQISFMGYKPAAIQSTIVYSAKEVVIEAELGENVIEGAATEGFSSTFHNYHSTFWRWNELYKIDQQNRILTVK